MDASSCAIVSPKVVETLVIKSLAVEPVDVSVCVVGTESEMLVFVRTGVPEEPVDVTVCVPVVAESVLD